MAHYLNGQKTKEPELLHPGPAAVKNTQLGVIDENSFTVPNVATAEVYVHAKELPTKDSFCNVAQKIAKPEFSDSGYEKNVKNPASEADKIELSTPILSETLDSYNGKYLPMKENPSFLKIYRAHVESYLFQSSRLKYKHVLQTIWYNIRYKEGTYYSNGKIIQVMPGQLCISLRDLVDLCNKNVKFKDDMVDKNTVERALSHFFLTCQFVRHEVRHGVSIITVIEPSTCDKNNCLSETTGEPSSETAERQPIYIRKKDEKEIKDVNVSSNFSSESRQFLEKIPNSKLSPKEKDQLARFPVEVLQRADKEMGWGSKTTKSFVAVMDDMCQRIQKEKYNSPQSSASPPSKQKTQNNKQVEINCDIELQNENKKHAEIKKIELESIGLFKLIEICRESVCLRLPGLEKNRIYYSNPRFKEIINALLGENYEKCKSNAVQSGSGNDCYRDDAKFGSV